MSELRFFIYIVFITISMVKINNEKKDCIFYNTIHVLGQGKLISKMILFKENLFYLYKLEFYVFCIYALFNFLLVNSKFSTVSLIIFFVIYAALEYMAYNETLNVDQCLNDTLWSEVDEALNKFLPEDIDDDEEK